MGRIGRPCTSALALAVAAAPLRRPRSAAPALPALRAGQCCTPAEITALKMGTGWDGRARHAGKGRVADGGVGTHTGGAEVLAACMKSSVGSIASKTLRKKRNYMHLARRQRTITCKILTPNLPPAWRAILPRPAPWRVHRERAQCVRHAPPPARQRPRLAAGARPPPVR